MFIPIKDSSKKKECPECKTPSNRIFSISNVIIS
jgi:hypothetical protein